MLVSSFGYLNKNSNSLNGIRVESVKPQKPIVNQGLTFDEKNSKNTEGMPTKSVDDAKHLNVIA